MAKFLAFIGWLVVSGIAYWWAASENKEDWVFVLISFISFLVLFTIFPTKKKEDNKGTTIVYVQPQNTTNKTSKKSVKSQKPKTSKKTK